MTKPTTKPIRKEYVEALANGTWYEMEERAIEAFKAKWQTEAKAFYNELGAGNKIADGLKNAPDSVEYRISQEILKEWAKEYGLVEKQ